MKKKINPSTNKEDYRCTIKEAAEFLGMRYEILWYRLKDKRSKLHPDFIPPMSVEYGKYFFWLSELEHFKKTKQFAIPKPKFDDKKVPKDFKILKFSKDPKN